MPIRRTFVALLVSLSVLMWVNPALSKDAVVYREFSPAMVKLVAEGLKITCQRGSSVDGLPKLTLDYGKFKATLLFYDVGPMEKSTSLGLTAMFGGGGFKLEAINAWNSNAAYSRAYLTDEGYPAIASDLFVQSGVTEGGLRNFLATFKSIVKSYAQHLLKSRKTK